MTPLALTASSVNLSAPKRSTNAAGGAGTPSGAGRRSALTNMYWPMTHGFRRSSLTHSLPPIATRPSTRSSAANGLPNDLLRAAASRMVSSVSATAATITHHAARWATG